ncbi:hypothetical protein EMIT0373P_50284 [Pseudomonas chlororaphis]
MRRRAVTFLFDSRQNAKQLAPKYFLLNL